MDFQVEEDPVGALGDGAPRRDPQNTKRSEAAAASDHEEGIQRHPAVERAEEVDVFLTAVSQPDTEMEDDGEVGAQVDVEMKRQDNVVGNDQGFGAPDGQQQRQQRVEQLLQDTSASPTEQQAPSSSTNGRNTSDHNTDDDIVPTTAAMNTDYKTEIDYGKNDKSSNECAGKQPFSENLSPQDYGRIDDQHEEQRPPVPNNEQPESSDDAQIENVLVDCGSSDPAQRKEEDAEHADAVADADNTPAEQKEETPDHTSVIEQQPSVSAEDGDIADIPAEQKTKEVAYLFDSSLPAVDADVNLPSVFVKNTSASIAVPRSTSEGGETSQEDKISDAFATSLSPPSTKTANTSTRTTTSTDGNLLRPMKHVPGAADIAEPPSTAATVSSQPSTPTKSTNMGVAGMPRPAKPRPGGLCAVEGCAKIQQGPQSSYMCKLHNKEWVGGDIANRAISSASKSKRTRTSTKRKKHPLPPSSTTRGSSGGDSDYDPACSTSSGRRSKRGRTQKTIQQTDSPDDDLKAALRLSMASSASPESGHTRYGRVSAATSVGLMEEVVDSPSLIDQVVRLTDEGKNKTQWDRILGVDPRLYYVLSYKAESNWCELVPMKKFGTFSEGECGQAAGSIGRDKWVLFSEEECGDLSFEISGDLVETVKAKPLANTTDANEEQWDILGAIESDVETVDTNQGDFHDEGGNASFLKTNENTVRKKASHSLVAEGVPSAPKFKRNNVVHAVDEGCHYRAVIRKVGEYDKEKGWLYQVHFQGWAKRYDKWLPESGLKNEPPPEETAGSHGSKVKVVDTSKQTTVDLTATEGKYK